MSDLRLVDHCFDLEVKIEKLQEQNKELIDLVKEAEIEMDSWRNLTEIDADSIFEWKEQKNKVFKKMRLK